MMSKRRTVIVDDEPAVCAVVRAILEDSEDYSVIGVASNGTSGLSLIRNESPDLVLLDLAMPGLDGLEVLEQLMDDVTPCQVVVLSGFAAESPAATSAAALGAIGYVSKDALVESLIPQLDAILHAGV